MKSWHRVQDVKAFLSMKGRIVRGPHAWTKKVLHWPVCARCGLMLLKNEASRRAAKAVCVTEEDE